MNIITYHPTDFPRYIRAMADKSFNINAYGDRGERKIHSITTLQFESVRLTTFYYFNNDKNKVDIRELAREGFFYNRLYDCIICTFCGNKIHQDHNFRAATTHRTLESCPMNKFPLHGNVPLVRPDAEDSLSKINYMLQESMSFKVKHAVPDERNEIFFHERFKVRRNINLSDYGVRLTLFTHYLFYLPPEKRPNRERLAEAGFVFTGFSDIVMCFHCKGGLYNIDVDDDPVKDHVTFYGHCAYIKDYCSRHGIVNDQVPKPLSEAMFTEDEQNLLMEHPLIKQMISKGYEKTIVKKKMVDFVFSQGCLPFCIETCISEVKKS
ncbi:UNVERIFIED_CONTAM: hypothetical protein RMT77_009210 [Armadillidium vulgare]|nr:E3 ubiquitin-protein ligase XIAP [Armadillidium vulgare]